MKNPDKRPVRFSDLINYFASEAYAPEIHLIIYFEDNIDQFRLQTALRLLLDAEPVLGCRLVESWRNAFWEPLSELELNNAKLLKIVSGPLSETKNALQTFHGEAIDGLSGPQLKALLFSQQSGDRLVLKINHVLCDASGFKEAFYRLCAIYNELGYDPGFRPDVSDGSRSLGQVYRNVNPFAMLAIFRRGLNELWRAGKPSQSQQYPAVNDKRSPLHLKFNHFTRERTARLLEYARNHDATLNDLLVTAVIRAIARQSNWEANNGKAMRLNGRCAVHAIRCLRGGYERFHW